MKHYALPLPCLFAILILATISCTETVPTGPDFEMETEVGLSKKPGRDSTSWAYVAIKDGNVVLSSFDGKTTKTLVRGGSESRYSPRFTEDGSEVAYGRSNELRIVGVDGSNDRPLFDFATFAGPWYARYDWIPGTSKIIYNGYGDVAVVDTQTGQPQWLNWPSLNPGYGWMGEVSAGPDLKKEVPGFQGPIVLGWGTGVDETSDMDVYVVMANEDAGGMISLDPSTIVRLHLPDDPNGRGHQNHPVFSPDGSAIAFQDKTHCCTGDELKVVGFDLSAWSFVGAPLLLISPSNTASLDRIGYQPAWAPYGDWIAFTGYFTGKGPYLHGQLGLVKPDGSQTNLLSSKAPYLAPDWNPMWK